MNNIDENKNKEYFIAEIDGQHCPILGTFLKEIAIVFRFPNYYGENINALWDCLGDLSWLNAANYSLVIKNSAMFLTEESKKTKEEIIELLSKISDDWNHVPNFDGEDQFRKRSDFKIVYD
ncbi:MAG TPA: barstar family protein [Chitinophagaceae bacterium]